MTAAKVDVLLQTVLDYSHSTHLKMDYFSLV